MIEACSWHMDLSWWNNIYPAVRRRCLARNTNDVVLFGPLAVKLAMFLYFTCPVVRLRTMRKNGGSPACGGLVYVVGVYWFRTNVN